ncbi:MAG: NADH-quinone oxidoreductase subunit NuoF [Akkermansia sp.]
MSEITYLPGKEPHPSETRRIFRNVDRVGYEPTIDCFIADGGYEMLRKALGMQPAEIIDEVKKSGLRGRGGAGFPTGLKWTFIPRGNTKPVYLVCNCDESEPGTFKDRFIVHQDPHQLIEGMIISCFAVGAHYGVLYMREEFPEAAHIMQKALDDAKERGFLGKGILGSDFDLEIVLHRGAGAYICGEETGLINSIEGLRPYPRIKPPFFPAAIGLYGCPTIVNNVESLCQVRQIINMGGEAYSKVGAQRSPGTRIIGVSGDVKKPGYYEIVSGSLTFGQLLNDVCGGPKDGRSFKAIIPGGSSAKVVPCSEVKRERDADGNFKETTVMDIPLDLDSIGAFGSMSGSGGIIVMDDSRSMPKILNNLNRFYTWESCGQCTPCREGNPWMLKITNRILAGDASPEDVDLLKSVADNICGKTVCAFGEACAWPTQSFVTKFKDEFLAMTKPINAQKPHSPEAAAARRFLTRED